MPVQIGTRESTFQEPFGLLKDCHRRVEMFLGVLVKVGEQGGQRLTAEQAGALDNALRYFRDAAPRHTADEEESLFPRLRAAGLTEAMEALEGDHQRVAPLHAETDRLGRRWIAEGLEDPEKSRFLAIAREMEALYRHHIRIEDEELFPAAEKALPPAECAAIGAEMARRRGL
jgi:hemerythrin-like domain-containing protein